MKMQMWCVLAVLVLAGCAGEERRDESMRVARMRAETRPAAATGLDHRVEDSVRVARAPDDVDAQMQAEPTIAGVRAAALARNADAQAALERYVAALARVEVRQSLPNPTLSYGWSSFDRIHQVGASQEVPFPTKLLLEGRAALADARALRQDLRAARATLAAQADAAFAGLWLARRAVAETDESLSLLSRFAEIARARYAQGVATQPDLLRVEIERDTRRAERATLVEDVEVAASALNALLDRAPDAPLGPIAMLATPATPAALPVLVESALASRAELDASLERARAADLRVDRAGAEWWPDVTLGGAYIRDYGRGEDEAALSAGISVPLAFGRIDALAAEAQAEARRARAEARGLRARVLDEVRTASARLRAALERARILGEDALPRAEANVSASEAAYTNGQIDFLALVDAQRVLLERRLERERSLADAVVRRAELERAVGGASD